jgi:hypothetical protein
VDTVVAVKCSKIAAGFRANPQKIANEFDPALSIAEVLAVADAIAILGNNQDLHKQVIGASNNSQLLLG